jgi:membrane protein implicated in regulation of membrane protease activity
VPHESIAESRLSSYVIWWIIAALLVGVELATGTFYLLAVGAAFAIGGVAAWAGLEAWVQFAVASAFSVIGIGVANRWRRSRAQPPPMPSLDLGQTVRVIEWRDNGTARVHYRGSYWDAELVTPDTPRGETMRIEDMRGSTLVLGALRQGG